MATTVNSVDQLFVQGIETIGGGVIEKGTDSEGEYYELYDGNILRINEPVGVTKLLASAHYSGNGVMTVNDDVITFGQKAGGTNLCALFDGAPTTDGTYVSGYTLQKPAGETGELVDCDMWNHGGCALYDSGNFYVAGYAPDGGLGLGATTTASILTLSNTNVVAYRHPIHISYNRDLWRLFVKKTDGYWYGVGYNLYGALGIGNFTQVISSWTQLTSLGTTVRELWNLGTTTGCTVVQQTNNSLWVAGYNGNGELGNNSTTNTNAFIDVSSAWSVTSSDTVLEVHGGFGAYDGSARTYSTLGMLVSSNGTSGTVRMCGYNASGQLGDASVTQRQVPVAPTGVPTTVTSFKIQGGGVPSCYALTSNNRLFVWGHNIQGQLGVGDITSKSTPVEITISGQVITDIFANAECHYYGYNNQSFLQTQSGRLYGAGKNPTGQLGLGTLTDIYNTYTLIPFDTGKYGRVVDIRWNGQWASLTTEGFYLTLLTDMNKVFGTGYNGRRGLSLDGETTNITSWKLLDFSFWGGSKGSEEPAGSSSTIAIGTVTAGDDIYDASVTNVGTPSAAVLNFLLPRGDPGTTAPDISGLTTLTNSELDTTNDRLLIYDNSTSSHKRISPIELTAGRIANVTTGTNSLNLLYASMADSDYFRLTVGGTATDSGWAELATSGDGNEPVYVRQYTGTFSTATRTLTLLDASGNSAFPGGITATTFTTPSLRSLKKDISPFLGDALDIIERTQIVNYKYIADATMEDHIGFIADDTPEELSGRKRSSMRTSDTIGVLLKAVQQLNQKISGLEKKIWLQDSR